MRGNWIFVGLAVIGAALIVYFSLVRPPEPGRVATRQPDVMSGTTGSGKGDPEVKPPAAPAETEASKAQPMVPPSFDIVRVSRSCTAVIAGRAAPGATVIVSTPTRELGRVKADPRGEWVLVPDLPLESGSRELRLAAQFDGQEPVSSPDTVVVVVPVCGPDDQGQQAIAVLTPQTGASRLMQVPSRGEELKATKGLSLDSVDYDEKGDVRLSGRAEPGATVQVYINNKPVGTAVADAAGHWETRLVERVDPGVYTLRVDQVREAGKVASRIELPFSRAAPEDIRVEEGRVVVQPGNNLWQISRGTYGRGAAYTVIYQANKTQIRDPDLIYPGQIFTLPKPGGPVPPLPAGPVPAPAAGKPPAGQ
ncbi:LysM peptidoglycan-binding domain-containing protein [Desertibaculum subflavum]|uniref:LysM peptidoglycan-binding domain-containing protein n=1 Tax=Desertibaculum subflavum TaxID=2268458 RepID=UPI000E669E51